VWIDGYLLIPTNSVIYPIYFGRLVQQSYFFFSAPAENFKNFEDQEARFIPFSVPQAKILRIFEGQGARLLPFCQKIWKNIESCSNRAPFFRVMFFGPHFFRVICFAPHFFGPDRSSLFRAKILCPVKSIEPNRAPTLVLSLGVKSWSWGCSLALESWRTFSLGTSFRNLNILNIG